MKTTADAATTCRRGIPASTLSAHRNSTIALVMVLLFASGDCLLGQPNAGVQLAIQRIASTDSFFLFATGPAATNFVLESSVDLKTWNRLYQAIGTPGTNPVSQLSYGWPLSEVTFLRALPGDSIDVLAQHWLAWEPEEYVFHLQHVTDFWGAGVEGTVRVRNGVVIAVTNAIDARTRLPIPNPDWSLFPSLTGLFEVVRREYESGTQQVRLEFDPAYCFPVFALLDRVLWAVDDEGWIAVSDFVAAPSPAH